MVPLTPALGVIIQSVEISRTMRRSAVLRGQCRTLPRDRCDSNTLGPDVYDHARGDSGSLREAGGDDPGAGVEEDAGTGVVCVEGGAQSVAGVLGRGDVQAVEEVAGVEKTEHVLGGGGGIGAVVNGFVDVGEVDVVELGRGQDASLSDGSARENGSR